MKESDLRPKNCPVLLAVPSPDGMSEARSEEIEPEDAEESDE